MNSEVRKHLNIPQLRAMLVKPKVGMHIWSRGTGKTEGLVAPTALSRIENMPRGAGVFVAATYLQLLDRTLPPVLRAWENYGIKQGIHYWVRSKPPKSLNIPKALYAPETPEHCIYFCNGAIIKLVSQDRPGTSNGMTIDWIIGDEAKYLNRQRFQEDLLPTNRGNKELFGHLSEHHSILLTTDMPTTPSAAWLFEYEDQMDPDLIELILGLQFQLDEYLKRLATPITAEEQAYIKNDIFKIERELFELRNDCVYYSEASILDNIEILGEEHLKVMQRNMSSTVFDTSILNKRIFKIVDGYYPAFYEDQHCYDSINYDYIDNIGLYLPEGIKGKDSWRKDKETKLDQPLHIAMDYGKFNCLGVAQKGATINDVHASFVGPAPMLCKDVVQQFCDYYKGFPNRTVHYHYDQTAIAKDGKIEESYKDQVVSVLKANDFNVVENYIGQAYSHDSKYILFTSVFKEDDRRYKAVRINRSNNKFLIISLGNAKAISTSKGIQKDKRGERKIDQDQRMTTHLSDMFDTLYIGMERQAIANTGQSFDIIM